MAVFTTNYEDLPDVSGAYVLIIDIPRKVRLTIPRFRNAVIEQGRYAYAGSARGPGGIRARCRRHLSKDKKRHWHIDHLTVGSSAVVVAAFPGGDECHLVETLMASTPCGIPVPGFGSSDCRVCTSHLLKLTAQPETEEIGLQNNDTRDKAG